MSLIAALVKEPVERVQAGIDYSCWLRSSGKLLALQIGIASYLVGEPLPALTLFGAYIAPSGKVVHLLVDGGLDGHDYRLLITARGSDGRIKQDHLLVRVEEAA